MPRLTKLAIVVLAALTLTSCASLDAETPAQKLFAAQSEFNLYQRIVIVYLSQPECSGAVVVGCAKPEVKATLKSMAVRIKSSLALAKTSLETVRAMGSVAAAASLVRELAVYLTRKEIAIEPSNVTIDPSPTRSGRARRFAGARDHGALPRHQRQGTHHGRGGPRPDARGMG